jgi:hypothetical protein
VTNGQHRGWGADDDVAEAGGVARAGAGTGGIAGAGVARGRPWCCRRRNRTVGNEDGHSDAHAGIVEQRSAGVERICDRCAIGPSDWGVSLAKLDRDEGAARVRRCALRGVAAGPGDVEAVVTRGDRDARSTGHPHGVPGRGDRPRLRAVTSYDEGDHLPPVGTAVLTIGVGVLVISHLMILTTRRASRRALHKARTMPASPPRSLRPPHVRCSGRAPVHTVILHPQPQPRAWRGLPALERGSLHPQGLRWKCHGSPRT